MSANSRSFIRRTCSLLVTAAALATAAGRARAAGRAEAAFYRLDDLSPDVVLEGSSFYYPTAFGPTGLTGWMLEDVLIVREVALGSPAGGRVEPNDVILEVNGQPLGDDPLRTLGEQVIVSEETGTMTLRILRNGRKRTVGLEIRRLPELEADWPFGCMKSEQILHDAAGYLASIQTPEGGLDTNARTAFGLAGLALLAGDDPARLENCRRLIHWYHNTGQIEDPDNASWGLGYMGTFLGEYYLRTGDRSALKVCRALCDRMAETQDHCGSWGHGGKPGHGYVQGGLMNPAAAGCWLALELFEECGVRSEKTLEGARRFFARFADTGTVPYGDHRPEYNGTGNSKDSLACLAFAVKGDAETAALYGRLCTDFPTHRVKGHSGGFMGFFWGNIAGGFNPHHPDYRRTLDHWKWMQHVGRRWDGAFLMPHSVTGTQYMFQGPIFNTGGAALVYGVPMKSLRIFGAPESVFGAGERPEWLARALELYQELEFDELRRTVKGDTPRGRQLLRAASAKEMDIAVSLEKAERALAEGNPVMARAVAAGLDAMCGGRLRRCRDILKEVESGKYRTILDAARRYDEHRWLVYTVPASREVIERLAASKDAGIYARFASDLLATSPDASKWIHTGSLCLRRYWDHKEKDPAALAGVKRLAATKGGNWTQWMSMKWLRENGHVKDDFVQQWQVLLPAVGMHKDKPPPTYRYFAVTST
ncbi:MAG: DUF6288 domain-containing protein, partial [Planctomycetota bacterium]